MNFLALIGDLVDSRHLRNRATVQRQLKALLARTNRGNPALASPFTLTLGDEFQALYADPRRLFVDIVGIMTALRPATARFAIAVGTLTTSLNRKQAIGMDGPVFHEARRGIESLRQSGRALGIFSSPSDPWTMANHGLNLIAHQMSGWRATRLQIMTGLMSGLTPDKLAAKLSISRRAVYKNMKAAALPDCMGFFDAAAGQLHASTR